MNCLYVHIKKIGNSKPRYFWFLFCVGLFLLCSCGLETYYDIAPPQNAVQQNPADGSANVGSIVDSPENQIFEFTALNLSSTLFISPGTAVYYRIYNNISDLQSDARQINNANTENTSNGFNKLESLRYLSMTSDINASSFIDEDGGRVSIRLVTDSTGATYNAGIYIGAILDANRQAIPQRYDNESFNFDPDTATDTQNTLPRDGDNDYDDGTNDRNSYWYVNAYAVSKGLNESFTPATSEVLSLGFIAYPSQ